MAEVLLSIIIPTRNRTQYAIPAIRSALSIPSADAECVVQDSSDSDALGRHLRDHLPDGRLRYNYTPPPVNMTENFNLGLAQSRAKYVCMIGDDDGVNPEIVAAARWASENNVDAILARVNIAQYFWPDYRHRYYGKARSATLQIDDFTGQLCETDLKRAMLECVREAGQLDRSLQLPRAYLGLVRRDCLEQIRRRGGVYFGGMSPDIYSSLAVADVAKRCCRVDYPLVVPGYSGGSVSGQHAMRRATRDDLVASRNLAWPANVPPLQVPEAIWAQAACAALSAMGRTDLLDQFNFRRLHAMCLVTHRAHIRETLGSFQRACRLAQSSYAREVPLLLVEVLRFISQQTLRYLPKILKYSPRVGATVITGLQDVAQAVEALRGHLSQNGRSFLAVCNGLKEFSLQKVARR